MRKFCLLKKRSSWSRIIIMETYRDLSWQNQIARIYLILQHVLGAARQWWRGHGAALRFHRSFYGTEHLQNQTRVKEKETESGLCFFLHPWEICAREHPLFPIHTCLWQKPAVLSRICTVWFYPMTSKFVFVDKLVGRAQLVRKWVVLISSLFMSVI